jgi:hypothetical protein
MTMAKHTRKSKAKASKKSNKGTGAGRKSVFSGKTIVKLTKENPRRAGSIGHKSFSLLRPGMKYEAYIAAGGRRQDLAFDIKAKHVKVTN